MKTPAWKFWSCPPEGTCYFRCFLSKMMLSVHIILDSKMVSSYVRCQMENAQDKCFNGDTNILAGVGIWSQWFFYPFVMALDILDHVFEENVSFRANSKQLFNILWDFCTYSCTCVHVLVFSLSGSWRPDTRQFNIYSFITAKTK